VKAADEDADAARERRAAAQGLTGAQGGRGGVAMPEDAAVYVHVPFCETKCPYCDFNSFALAGRDVDGYLDALRREMDARGVPSRPETVFVGGGTPTVVEPDQLDRYLADLVARFARPPREFTVEANPGSLTPEKVAVLKAHGVGRVSLGAQSVFARHLATLGRVHSPADVDGAYRMVRAAGLAVNLDFIFAVPGMTRREWAETLAHAIDLAPDHLSCYALTFEPGTEFFVRRAAGRLRAAGEEDELFMFRYTARRLREAGYARYEISNFARPGQACRHNLNYWRNGSYAGYGAGAFSCLRGARSGNERGLGRYAHAVRETGAATATVERLDAAERTREAVALALRLAEGADLGAVADRHLAGELLAIARRLEPLVRVGENGRVRLHRRGWALADAVAAEFL